MTAIDDVPGPRGQVFCGLSSEQVGLNAEPRPGPSGEVQLCAGVRGPSVRARLHQAVENHSPLSVLTAAM